jgi:hypothetical protein
MKHSWLIILATGLFIGCGCQSPEQKLNSRLRQTITSYMTDQQQKIEIDSIRIYHIDTLTALDFAYMYKLVLENVQNTIYQNPVLYMEHPGQEQLTQQEKLQQQLAFVSDKLLECDQILSNPTTDTVGVKCFFAASKVCGKDSAGNAIETEIGFPINTDFKVIEMPVESR